MAQNRQQPRQVVVGAWGKYLESLRGRRRPAVVVRRLAALQIPFTRGTLWQYEHGTVGAPDPIVIGGLADIYGTDVRCLLAVLKGNRLDVNLNEAGVEQILDEEIGRHHATARAASRLAEIRSSLRDAIARLIEISANTEDGGTTDEARRQVAGPGRSSPAGTARA